MEDNTTDSSLRLIEKKTYVTTGQSSNVNKVWIFWKHTNNKEIVKNFLNQWRRTNIFGIYLIRKVN